MVGRSVWRYVALPARQCRCRARPHGVVSGTADTPPQTRQCDSRRGRADGSRRAGAHGVDARGIAGLAGRSGVVMEPGTHGLPDVRHPRPHLGRSWRAYRTDQRVGRPGGAVPRTLRRLRRPARCLPGVQGLVACVHRLRADVCDARRGRARVPAAFRARWQWSSRDAHDGRAPRTARRAYASGDAAKGRAVDTGAGRGVRRVARRAWWRGTGLRREPLRPTLQRVLSRGRRDPRRDRRGVCDLVVSTGASHPRRRHGPPSPGRAAGHCRRHDRVAAGVGAPAWLHLVRPGNGATRTQ